MYEKFGLFSYDLTKFMEKKLWTVTIVCDRYVIVTISIWMHILHLYAKLFCTLDICQGKFLRVATCLLLEV